MASLTFRYWGNTIYFFKRSIQQLLQQESDAHARRVEQAVAKMHEVVAGGPYQATDASLLKYDTPLDWHNSGNGLAIELPQRLLTPNNRPGQFAWCFRFEAKETPDRENGQRIQSKQ